jgi:hypothetical protein
MANASHARGVAYAGDKKTNYQRPSGGLARRSSYFQLSSRPSRDSPKAVLERGQCADRGHDQANDELGSRRDGLTTGRVDQVNVLARNARGAGRWATRTPAHPHSVPSPAVSTLEPHARQIVKTLTPRMNVDSALHFGRVGFPQRLLAAPRSHSGVLFSRRT